MKFKAEQIDFAASGINNRISAPDAAILVWNFNIRMKNSNAHYNPYRVGSQTVDPSAANTSSTRWASLLETSTELPDDESMNVDDDGTILISGNSIIDITTEKSKASPRGSFQIVLAATANWLGYLTTGSWLCIMMASQLKMQEKHLKRGDRKFVKMIGRIESVRIHHAAAGDGSRVCTYIVSGADWGEIFNSTIWFQGDLQSGGFLPLLNYYNYRVRTQDFFEKAQKAIDTKYSSPAATKVGSVPKTQTREVAAQKTEVKKKLTKKQKEAEAKKLAAQKVAEDKQKAANDQAASAESVAAPQEPPVTKTSTFEAIDVESDFEYPLFSGTTDGDSHTGSTENSLGTLLPINLLRHLLRFFGLFVLELDLLDQKGQVLKNSAIGENYLLRKPRISLAIPPAMTSFLVGEEEKKSIYGFVTSTMQKAYETHKKIISMDFNSLNFFIKIVGGRIRSFDAKTINGGTIQADARRIIGAREITDPEQLVALKSSTDSYIPYYEKNSYTYAEEGRGALVNSFRSVSPQTTLWKVMGQSCFEAVNELYCEMDFPDTDLGDTPLFTKDNESEEEKILGPQPKGKAELSGIPNSKSINIITLRPSKGTGDISKDVQIPIVSSPGYFYISVSSDFPTNLKSSVVMTSEGSATEPKFTLFKKTQYVDLDKIPPDGSVSHDSKDFTIKDIKDNSVYVAKIVNNTQYFLRYSVSQAENLGALSPSPGPMLLSVFFFPTKDASREPAANKKKTTAINSADKTRSANSGRAALKFKKPEMNAPKGVKGELGKFGLIGKGADTTLVPNSVVLDVPRSPLAPFVVCCRIRPFVIRTTGWGLDYQDASQDKPLTYAREMASYFQDVARVPIPMETIISVDAGTNIADASNFIQIRLANPLKDSLGGFGGFQTYDLASIERLGLRVLQYTPGEFAIMQAKNNPKIKSPVDMMNAWKYLIREWYGEGHNYLNGRMKIHGMDYHIPVGNNIFCRAEALDPSLNFNQSNSSVKMFDGTENRTSNRYFLAHVENVSNSFSVGQGGGRTYTTTIDFTHGIFCDQDYITGKPEDRQSIESDVAAKALYDNQSQNRNLDVSSSSMDFSGEHAASSNTSDPIEMEE